MKDLELRLATLAKLLDNPAAPVQERLVEELRRAERTLQQSVDYDELDAALKTLAVLARKFHGAIVPTLHAFVRSVPSRNLTQGGEPIAASRLRHRSASHLICDAIDVPNSLRYVRLEEVLDFLLDLSRNDDEEVCKKARRALDALAEFNLNHFGTLGARPQTAIVESLSKRGDDQLREDADAILSVLRVVLSSSMQGHAFTYNAVTISRGSVVSGAGVSEMRASAIALLKRMYQLKDEVSYHTSVLSVLNAATHRESGAVDGDTTRMFERDAVTVLTFLRELVAGAALPLVQTIEHQAYWDYFHAATPEIEKAALQVRDAVGLRPDYQIYKQLIGFEGIFGDWEKLRRSEEEWDYSNTKRQEAARHLVDSIGETNQIEWRDRILEFSKTESEDLATFPVYYEFLELLGQTRPGLALELVREHELRMRPFLIPLIGGLWNSECHQDIDATVQRWIDEGSHIETIAKSVLKGGASRLAVLSRVVARSAELDNRYALSVAMGVAAALYGEGCNPAKDVFMTALREMAKRNDASWASTFWFGREFKRFAEAMSADEQAEVLASMVTLPELSYQAEEVLRAIGEKNIDALMNFLEERLTVEIGHRAQRRRDGGDLLDDKFEAIPYHLHALKNVLQEHPQAVLAMLRRGFKGDEAASMFPYRSGARLIKAVFPGFEPEFQKLLLDFVASGDRVDLEFVLAIVRSYGGGAPILDVCKAIVKVVPQESKEWRTLAAAIKTIGGVWGEYGLVNAFEAKRDEIAAWRADEDALVRAFADWLTEQLERMIAFEKQQADEELTLRKYRYGIGKGED
ncbi:hypothetical protein [Azohydromonas lata]|uniref:Uncharacterized protein n=1 Tax=Azohydromonas lata TaxID=45677 RepID=A0ABU5I9K6_9BURK|nr:hypothetical protein [Azohydromonas lata]MDZ5455791.1 hypothetical protein [Azohydromonas lata]